LQFWAIFSDRNKSPNLTRVRLRAVYISIRLASSGLGQTGEAHRLPGRTTKLAMRFARLAATRKAATPHEGTLRPDARRVPPFREARPAYWVARLGPLPLNGSRASRRDLRQCDHGPIMGVATPTRLAVATAVPIV